ncbi:hypothetical protein EW145_g2079 [Phellinidium pouzarii]|uniref:Xylanolytic transcriptional activator regulatory domain-containing protein n=1 Tax=Phellinidium pouzarii TaxID=167371 RepID=A0A4S4LC71_9AGAM|nr:hypothetical protein EW145_g2079 [Phellinidium pouzarii]
MASERPSYLPPFSPRADGTDNDREHDPVNIPLPRTASSAQSNPSIALSRAGSGASRARTQHGHVPRSPSAYSTTFTIPSISSAPAHPASLPPQTSSTHAGGILPSASFFHPSRPTFYSNFNPSTFNSSNNVFNSVPLSSIPRSNVLTHSGDPRPESMNSDSFAHASFTTDENARSNSGRERAGSLANANSAPRLSSLPHTFSTKVSKEPLLPIGQKPKPPVPAQPGISRSASGRKLPGIGGRGRWNEGTGSILKGSESSGMGGVAGGRVRTSVEKFLRRTLSVDAPTMEYSHSKSSDLPAKLEDLESRGRGSGDPYIEFKSTPGGMFDEEGTMNITHNANATPFTRRRSVFRPRFPNFDPVDPSTDPPASRTPILDSSGKLMRKYRLHPSQNTFFLKGRILTGGDSVWPFVCSVILLLGIAGTWSGTTAVWWWKHESPAVAIVGGYMCLLTIANMMATAFSDPGILPRNLDPDPPYANTSSTDDSARAPLPRDLKVRSGVSVKGSSQVLPDVPNIPTSSIESLQDVRQLRRRVRPPLPVGEQLRRTTKLHVIHTAAYFGGKHRHCVLDNHTLTLCLIICTSALHLVIQAHDEHIDAKESLRLGAGSGSAVVFVLTVIVIWPVGGLLGYHMRLLLLNLTTIEQIRNSAHKSLASGPPPPNPFALGNWRHNLAEMLCRTQGMSWLAAAEIATEDKREPNPGAEIGDDSGTRRTAYEARTDKPTLLCADSGRLWLSFEPADGNNLVELVASFTEPPPANPQFPASLAEKESAPGAENTTTTSASTAPRPLTVTTTQPAVSATRTSASRKVAKASKKPGSSKSRRQAQSTSAQVAQPTSLQPTPQPTQAQAQASLPQSAQHIQMNPGYPVNGSPYAHGHPSAASPYHPATSPHNTAPPPYGYHPMQYAAHQYHHPYQNYPHYPMPGYSPPPPPPPPAQLQAPPSEPSASTPLVPKRKRKGTIDSGKGKGSGASDAEESSDMHKKRTKTQRACDLLVDSEPPMCQHCKQYGFDCTFFLPITETRFKKKRLEEEAQVATAVAQTTSEKEKTADAEGSQQSPLPDSTRNVRVDGPTSMTHLLHSTATIPPRAYHSYDQRYNHTWEVSKAGDGLIQVLEPSTEDSPSILPKLVDLHVERDVIEKLINSYFTDVAPLVPIVTQAEFLALSDPSPPPILLYSICLVAASKRDVPQAVFDSLRVAVNDVIKSEDCADCHSQFVPTALSSLWIRLGTAIRMAQDLGLHRAEAVKKNIEMRRRVWGACVITDRWTSLTYGHPYMIDIEDCDARLPSSGDPNDHYTDELLRLSLILGRVLKTIYGPSGLTYATDEKLYALLSDMKGWQENLPEDLKYRGLDTPRSGGLLHLLYASVTMLFWRVFMRISYSCPAHLKFNLTIDQWTELTQMTGDAIDWLDAHETLYDVWMLVAYAVTSCALVQTAEIISLLYETTLGPPSLDHPPGLNPTNGVVTKPQGGFKDLKYKNDPSRPGGGVFIAHGKAKNRDFRELPEGTVIQSVSDEESEGEELAAEVSFVRPANDSASSLYSHPGIGSGPHSAPRAYDAVPPGAFAPGAGAGAGAADVAVDGNFSGMHSSSMVNYVPLGCAGAGNNFANVNPALNATGSSDVRVVNVLEPDPPPNMLEHMQVVDSGFLEGIPGGMFDWPQWENFFSRFSAPADPNAQAAFAQAQAHAQQQQQQQQQRQRQSEHSAVINGGRQQQYQS